MIHFFAGKEGKILYAVQTVKPLSDNDLQKLIWLFDAEPSHQYTLVNNEAAIVNVSCIGPRASMVTPWSTNAVEITQNMGIAGISRIERYTMDFKNELNYDKMLSQRFTTLHQDIFTLNITPEPVKQISDIASFNKSEGLALNDEEVAYLNSLSAKLGRKLTDSEVFGFSQVNSEHCRHKIFNGTFIIDGAEKDDSLFKLIKKTSKKNPNEIVSAYKDNVAFINGPKVTQFAPSSPEKPDYYKEEDFESVLSLKAETHNFPTTVEPFNGAATGSGGEIRDRLAGGQGSIPLAGTAVYMTSYARLLQDKPWEKNINERKWLYQSPLDILIKASNGASDFGNKYGQPLIAGSLLTFEHDEADQVLGYDKVIMLAGGVGYGKKDQSVKQRPTKGDEIIVLGGENYRIGMGGAAVSSADTGAFASGIELNAIQRSNPEMQKRVANTIRGLVEISNNPILSIHDHGAGGHLNCLSELVDEVGGEIYLEKLPIGDPTLSVKEIIGNESQERMGLVIHEKDLALLKQIAERERAPIYQVGKITGDHHFKFKTKSEAPFDLKLEDMFGSSPQTILTDVSLYKKYEDIQYEINEFDQCLEQILQLESVACKDWLTNKVDRCVGGRVAKQQCTGPLQLPLNDVGVMALDYKNHQGIATSIGHAPIAALINEAAGSRLAIAEALTNIVFAPLEKGIKSISLSANWMWACKNKGEDARLYNAVKACSDFAIALGINIPTGKDSLSMKQKYTDKEVIAPGTVIISAAGHCTDINRIVEPTLQKTDDKIYYIDFSFSPLSLGGSGFAQIKNKVGRDAPDVSNADDFVTTFNLVQRLIKQDVIKAGHDIGSGGLITTLLEMCFADINTGATINLTGIIEKDTIKILFSENPAIVVQAHETIQFEFEKAGLKIVELGSVVNRSTLSISNFDFHTVLDINHLRDIWYKASYLLDTHQSLNGKAEERYANYKNQPLNYIFPESFSGKLPVKPLKRPKAAVIREKGSNSERELANALYRAGFDVKDVHMTDLTSGRENLLDIQFIGAVGGFSNSDVLGSAKGWAGAFKYNEQANKTLKNFFARQDTLSIGICNGCQLFMELDLIHPDHPIHGRMHHNDSGKFECVFTSVKIQENKSVMMREMAGLTLGIWSAHGEGKFHLPYTEDKYNVVAKFGYEDFPSNPNGSMYNIAMLCDDSGRHLVSMPHMERSLFPWNWGYYPEKRLKHEVSPWIDCFVAAREWVK